ncbi:unnamed protein product [Miscanthus lutarioriparius]|uniref:Uncharacterized protein n=1 Tax=Miscanthus lutarioriparius TaxID=422564 RepID=A0A811SEA3_9POAL|nr:unnamed protein product [Miscanthus lutarioriparius]
MPLLAGLLAPSGHHPRTVGMSRRVSAVRDRSGARHRRPCPLGKPRPQQRAEAVRQIASPRQAASVIAFNQILTAVSRASGRLESCLGGYGKAP